MSLKIAAYKEVVGYQRETVKPVSEYSVQDLKNELCMCRPKGPKNGLKNMIFSGKLFLKLNINSGKKFTIENFLFVFAQ